MTNRKSEAAKQTITVGRKNAGETTEQRAIRERKVFSQSEKFNLLALQIIGRHIEETDTSEFREPLELASDDELTHLRNQIKIFRDMISSLEDLKKLYSHRLRYLQLMEGLLLSPD